MTTIVLPHAEFTLNLANPIWFGPYHGAKLAIFEGHSPKWLTVEAKSTLGGCDTYFAVMSECQDGGEFTVYGHYSKGVHVEEVSAHLQGIIYIEYLKQRSLTPPSSTSFH